MATAVLTSEGEHRRRRPREKLESKRPEAPLEKSWADIRERFEEQDFADSLVFLE